MRLSTIWTMSAMALSERIRRTGEWVMQGLAHRLPRKLAYWSLIDTGARCIKGNEVVPEVSFMDVVERASR